MSLIETVHLSHVPENLPVFIALYKDVTNAGFLREQLISGNEDFQYAFIDASTILSKKHIFAAVFRAINDHLNNRLKSHNVHSEIVVALGPSNNIADSLRRFGVADTTKDLLVVKLPVTSDITADSVTKHLEKYVEATPVPFNDETISTMSDLAKIRKLYKLNQLASASPMDHVNTVKSLEPLILGSIAIRGAT